MHAARIGPSDSEGGQQVARNPTDDTNAQRAAGLRVRRRRQPKRLPNAPTGLVTPTMIGTALRHPCPYR